MLVYIMSPYSGSQEQMRRRFLAASLWTTRLAEAGIPIISPIMHWHEAANTYNLPKDHQFWFHQNLNIMQACDAAILLALEDWELSKGVAAEMDWMRKHKKPVYILDLEPAPIDGYHELCLKTLLKALHRDYPLLREAPTYATSP